MPTVHPDILSGTRGRKTAEGWELERVFVVEGVTGDGNAKVVNAVDEIDIPIGAGHPAKSTAYLRSIIPERVDGDKVQLRYLYNTVSRDPANPDGDQTNITYDSSVTQRETEKDINGNRIHLEYNYDFDNVSDIVLWFGDENNAPEGICTANEPVQIDAPQHTVNIVKRLLYSPAGFGEAYVGTVNASQWKTYPARTLKCTNIRGVSTDDGLTFITTFSFQYNPDTWDQHVTWTFPNGKKPTEAQIAEQIRNNNTKSYRIYRLYSERNFGSLPL